MLFRPVASFTTESTTRLRECGAVKSHDNIENVLEGIALFCYLQVGTFLDESAFPVCEIKRAAERPRPQIAN